MTFNITFNIIFNQERFKQRFIEQYFTAIHLEVVSVKIIGQRKC